MSNPTDAGAAGNPTAAAPSQADVLADNEALKGQVASLTTRATTAEGNIALLTTQRDAAASQVSALTKQVGELTTQLTAANGELATLRQKAESASKQAAGIVAKAGIVGGATESGAASPEKRKTLTEQAIANRKAAGLPVPTV